MSSGFNNYYGHSESNFFDSRRGSICNVCRQNPCCCQRSSNCSICRQSPCACNRFSNVCDCSECHRDFKVCCNDRCLCSLAEELCQYINQKVVISIGGCRIPVIICEITECIVKAIGYTACGKVYYFNLNRIDSVDAILPRY